MKRNKIICIVIAVCLLIGCSAYAATRKNNITGSKLKVTVGQEFDITLEQNPSTGYSWDYKINSDAIKLINQKTVNSNPEGLVGAPSKGVWTFKASTKGTYKIIFSYSRPWEKDTKPVKTVEYTIEVN